MFEMELCITDKSYIYLKCFRFVSSLVTKDSTTSEDDSIPPTTADKKTDCNNYSKFPLAPFVTKEVVTSLTNLF